MCDGEDDWLEEGSEGSDGVTFGQDSETDEDASRKWLPLAPRLSGQEIECASDFMDRSSVFVVVELPDRTRTFKWFSWNEQAVALFEWMASVLGSDRFRLFHKPNSKEFDPRREVQQMETVLEALRQRDDGSETADSRINKGRRRFRLICHEW
jgi:hypothetical protein